MMRSNSWIVTRPNPSAKVRMFCFCYAGGSAVSFLEWQSAVDPSVLICALQLPGRGARFTETPYESLPELVSALARVISPMTDLPCVFFGHSLGGLLAFELARYHHKHGLMMPRHLFVSGCDAASCRSPSQGMHRLDDGALIARLRQYNGTPPEVLAHSELMALMLPTIRADFALVENYQYHPGPALPVPLTVLAGTRDDFDSPDQVDHWARETSSTFRVQWFDGDHFFIHSHQAEVLACLGGELSRMLDHLAIECA